MPEPAWPRCRRCGKQAVPGTPCDQQTCPFARVLTLDGPHLITPKEDTDA